MLDLRWTVVGEFFLCVFRLTLHNAISLVALCALIYWSAALKHPKKITFLIFSSYFLIKISPFKYSPSGNVTVIG